jgi:hypothetical protein
MPVDIEGNMHPYEGLEDKYFWATAVAKRNMFDIADLWTPKFKIGKQDKIVTFGSCFAQHIGRALESRDFNWMVTERAPFGFGPENAKKFNYGVFSARTGNIYTVSLLRQWVCWAVGDLSPPYEVWEKAGRFYDPFRPNIEPNGFASEEEMLRSREIAIEAFRLGLAQSTLFVFTLGLTESWFKSNKQQRYEYPMCPGTVAGEFDASQHVFVNQGFQFIWQTLTETIQRIKDLNSKIKFLLTVSPVPLTATMSGNHVLVATMESKSILRAVAGTVRDQFDFVDYFPSYEIINATPFRGTFFESNQRSINHVGVDHVMNCFFNCLTAKFPMEATPYDNPARPLGHSRTNVARTEGHEQATSGDVVCEEELLNAFAKN